MIPINAPCPECLSRMTAGVDAMPETERNNLFFWCPHNRVSAAVEVLPGRLVGHWILRPALTEAAALAGAQAVIDDAAFLEGLLGDLAQAQRPSVSH